MCFGRLFLVGPTRKICVFGYTCIHCYRIALEENFHIKSIATVVELCLYFNFGIVCLYETHVIVYICGVVLRDEAGNKI